MNKQEQKNILIKVNEWLSRVGKSREWLADQMGVSLGTVNGWFAPKGERPIPTPNVKLLQRMLAEDELGEPRFSFFEADQIKRAMKLADYISYPEFAHDAVIAKTDAILALEANLSFLPESETSKAAETETRDHPMPPQNEGTNYRGKKPRKEI